MFSQPQYIAILQRERRQFATHNQQLQKSQQLQKQKADQLEEEVKKKDKQMREKDKKIAQLEDELEKARLTITTYKKMLFEKHKNTEIVEEQAQEQAAGSPDEKTKKRNGQKVGHKGYGRKEPEVIDQQVECFVDVCPDCGNQVERGSQSHSHTVTDIPHWSQMKPVTTQYQIDYQWCVNCHKAVSAVPSGVIPGSRIGINLFLMILIWRYQLRLPFKKISEILFMQYGVSLSSGGLVGSTKRARQFFGKRYDDLLTEIRGAPVKHADETTWGMDGLLYWCWIFLTEKSVYYTIEETRGKGVPQRILKDAIGILIRDGYAGYVKLPLIQQACFAHVYRKARDANERKGASEEAKELFHQIQQLYGLLAEDIKRPFVKQEREELFNAYKKDLEKISNRAYQHQDAKRVQTYIKNLGDNLLTALLYENVPLTNNKAEQAARQIVIGRKISGGSRSKEGAKTHAVNMSIMQTILKQRLPLFATLESYLLEELPLSYLKN
jgi:transposase